MIFRAGQRLCGQSFARQLRQSFSQMVSIFLSLGLDNIYLKTFGGAELNARIRLTWEGKMDAEMKARKDVQARLEQLHSVGAANTGNAVIWGDGAYASALAGMVSGRKRFDFAYVNADAAAVGMKGEVWAPQRLSNLLQILIRVQKLTDAESFIAVRLPADIQDEAYLVVKEVFSDTHEIKHVPALQGSDGHCILAVAVGISGIICLAPAVQEAEPSCLWA